MKLFGNDILRIKDQNICWIACYMQVCSVFCWHTSFENVPQHIMVSSIQSHRILENIRCAEIGQTWTETGLSWIPYKFWISSLFWNSGQVWALSIRRSTINNRIVMFMYESAIQLRVLDLFNWVAIFETRLFLKIRNEGLHSQFNYDHGNPKQ